MCIGAIASASRATREQEASKRLSDQTALAAHLIVHIKGGNEGAIERTIKEAERLGHRVSIDGMPQKKSKKGGLKV